MGEFFSRELTVGQCDPASDAFFSRNIQTTDQSNARSRKIYYLSGNLSCLFFCDLFMRNDQFYRRIRRMAYKEKGKVAIEISIIYH